jgi:hypothetical protein
MAIFAHDSRFPMMSQRVFNQMSLVILALMAAMLLLVIFKAVPVSWYWPMFAIVLVLFLIRTTLRLILARQARIEEQRKKAEGNPPENPVKPIE